MGEALENFHYETTELTKFRFSYMWAPALVIAAIGMGKSFGFVTSSFFEVL